MCIYIYIHTHIHVYKKHTANKWAKKALLVHFVVVSAGWIAFGCVCVCVCMCVCECVCVSYMQIPMYRELLTSKNCDLETTQTFSHASFE